MAGVVGLAVGACHCFAIGDIATEVFLVGGEAIVGFDLPSGVVNWGVRDGRWDNVVLGPIPKGDDWVRDIH